MSISLKKPKGYPEISFLSFDVRALLQKVQNNIGLNSVAPVSFTLQTMELLACIRLGQGETGGDIYIHSLFNRPDVPQPVIEHILYHELLHLIIPSRNIDGKRVNHPPEFWDAEKALVPWKSASWEWMYSAFWDVIKIDPINECVRVKKSWRKLQQNPYPSWQLGADNNKGTSENESHLKTLMENL